jgi:hypothetical protein
MIEQCLLLIVAEQIVNRRLVCWMQRLDDRRCVYPSLIFEGSA